MSNGNLDPETTLQQALDRSSFIQEQICTLLNGRRNPALSADKQTKIASALFGLTIDQARNVTFLCQNERYGGGLVLTRSAAEACMRGRWVKYVAGAGAIRTYSFDKMPKNMSRLIKETMSCFSDPDGTAAAFCSWFPEVYGRLSKFVHGDVEMFGMQLSETGLAIASQYDLEQVREVLKISDVMQLIAAQELLDFAGEQYQADVEKISTFLGVVLLDEKTT